MVTRDSFPEGKTGGAKTVHLPPSSAGVQNAHNYTSNPQHVLRMWYLVKHTDTSNFYLNVLKFI